MSKLYERINNNEVYVIAEMSANHGGNLDYALEIVRGAAKAGADCLKIQTYTADTLTIDCDNEYFQIKGGLWDGYKLYDLYGDANTPWEWHKAIKDECEKCGIDFLSTPFDNTAVDFLEELGADSYKIASFELPDIPLIEYAASKGKPMIISCGMGTPEDIEDALEACKRAGNDQVVLLKCCSEYPANWEDMHLGNIPDMAARFNIPIGLSDHSAGSLAAVVGVSMGACVVEKHVCISREIKTADSEFSMELTEFADMVRDIRNAKVISAGPCYTLTEKEKSSTIFRRSLFAIEDINAGDIITKENVRSIRPGNGIKPKYLKDLIGKPAPHSLKRGEPIPESFLK
ncbi:MAG: pseudaminic acid synthase [Lachnospiraceae bacterium]|nr:pseudaminic acid synthase [Lachnospiraceae bacterium]